MLVVHIARLLTSNLRCVLRRRNPRLLGPRPCSRSALLDTAVGASGRVRVRRVRHGGVHAHRARESGQVQDQYVAVQYRYVEFTL